MIKYDYEQINKSRFAEGLVMIHYDIDTTENGYKKFEGNIELLIELKRKCLIITHLQNYGGPG